MESAVWAIKRASSRSATKSGVTWSNLATANIFVFMDLPLDTVFGLPVHALVVHSVVVLIPLSALGAILMACWPHFSRRFGPLVVLIALVSVGFALISKESGAYLAARVGLPQVHSELGSSMPLIALAFFAVLLVFWLFDRGIPGNRHRPIWVRLLAVLLIALAVFATIWVIRVGHSGAEATWLFKISQTN
ncbi:hypothetical protein LBMAG15_06280 [Actinomycetes bacterium]|nr:hypothetical protein LBMAG15_06280 [Actinomycetes bacterium]